MAFKKENFDKKTVTTLVAFIIVGLLLFFTIFAWNGIQRRNISENNNTPDINNNVATTEEAFYGKEAVLRAGTVYDSKGAEVDLSALTRETELYDKNGKKINLPTVSAEEYYSLEKGLSYKEVCKSIGGEGEIIGEVDKPGDEFYTVAYFFYGDKAETSATFVFQGDRLMSMANTDIEKP